MEALHAPPGPTCERFSCEASKDDVQGSLCALHGTLAQLFILAGSWNRFSYMYSAISGVRMLLILDDILYYILILQELWKWKMELLQVTLFETQLLFQESF